MRLFKPYNHIPNFLYRYTILHIGDLHIRIHKIVSKDITTLLHTHPFNYVSLILWGGYTETLKDEDGSLKKRDYAIFSVIKRKNFQYHRIEEIKRPTYTLFVTWGKYNWQALNLQKDGTESMVFERLIKGEILYAKKQNGIWYAGNKNKQIAQDETRHSIYQV